MFRSSIGGRNPLKSSDDAIGDYELRYSNERIVARKVEGEEKTPTKDDISVIRSMLATKKGPNEFLQFPLSVGKKWDFEYTRTGRSRDAPTRSQVEVTKLEDVTTPAGTFRAFKLERLDTGGPKMRLDRVYYYSPQTGSIVKYRLESKVGQLNEVELVKFGSTR